MYSEIEAKLKVDSLDEVETKLKELSAEFIEQRFQSDCHYDDAEATLTNSDKCLRLLHGFIGRMHLCDFGHKRQFVNNHKLRRLLIASRRRIQPRLDDLS